MLGFVYIYGGGYVLGKLEMVDDMNLWVVGSLGVVVVLVDYRLVLEYLIFVLFDDCYVVFVWIYVNVDEFGVDMDCIVIGGESVGGGFVVVLGLMVWDKGEYLICF